MSDPEDREIIREPHPEVVRWVEYDLSWPADKPFPLTPLEAWHVMQGHTVRPAATCTFEKFMQLPGNLEGGPTGIMLHQRQLSTSYLQIRRSAA